MKAKHGIRLIKYCNQQITPIKVGSIFCKQCIYHKGITKGNKVKCDI